MAILYNEQYFYADNYSIVGETVTFLYKGVVVLVATLKAIRAYKWSLT